MNENNVMTEGGSEIVHRLPATFQKFVSIYKEAEKKTREKQNINVNNSDNNQELACNLPLEDSEFDRIQRNLSDIGLLIMNNIRGEGSSSKELAEKLEVSIDTIKRRYKDLLAYGMVKTTRRCGVRLTQRGLEFLSKLKLKVENGSIVAE